MINPDIILINCYRVNTSTIKGFNTFSKNQFNAHEGTSILIKQNTNMTQN